MARALQGPGWCHPGSPECGGVRGYGPVACLLEGAACPFRGSQGLSLVGRVGGTTRYAWGGVSPDRGPQGWAHWCFPFCRSSGLNRLRPASGGGRAQAGAPRWRSKGYRCIGGVLYRVSANKLSKTCGRPGDGGSRPILRTGKAPHHCIADTAAGVPLCPRRRLLRARLSLG